MTRAEYKHQWYLKNKDLCQERTKNWKKNNIEKIKKSNKKYNDSHKDQKKAYYENNKTKILQQIKEWQQNNPDSVKKFQKKHRDLHKEQKKEYRESHKLERKEYFKDNKNHILQKQQEYNDEHPWMIHHSSYIQRCTNTNHKQYNKYKDRIGNSTVQDFKDVWIRDRAYEMERPEIDRIDNNRGYFKDNIQFLEKSNHIIKSCFERKFNRF